MTNDSIRDPQDDVDEELEIFLHSAFRNARSDSVNEQDETDDVLSESDCPERLGRYEILGLVGRGGVGIVYRAKDAELGRELAIKVIRARHAKDPELRHKFEEEARLCSQLTHPGVVPVHEIGELDDGRPYFTMKLVEGHTLASLLRRRDDRSNGRRDSLAILVKVCDALAYAHAQGVVHGDVKPHNVMVGAFGEVQLMDWGFARRVTPAESVTATTSSSTRGGGTPAYMAPEQAREEQQLTPRTDVFGLGAILCEILTGQPPYLGETKREVIGMAAEGRLTNAIERLDACGGDEALVTLALSCLALAPEERPSDAGEVADRLNDHLEGIEEHARAMELRAAAAQASRRLWIALMGSIVAAVVIVAVVMVGTAGRRERRRSAVARDVHRALGEAQELRARAEADSDLDAYRAAAAAARRALAIAETPDGDGSDVQHARSLATEIDQAYGQAARELALIQRLEEISPHSGDDLHATRIENDFSAAFAAAGIDASVPPTPKTLEHLHALSPHPTIIGALDTWVYLRRFMRIPTPDAWKIPAALVRELDPDPWRVMLREAYEKRDVTALRAVARQASTSKRPAISLDILARCLWGLRAKSDTLRVLRMAHDRYPGDYRVSHDLAVHLDRKEPAAAREAVHALWMAVAARPHDAHLRVDLGLYLMDGLKDVHQAIRVLEQAKGMAPESGRPRAFLGFAYMRVGRFDEAIQALRFAAERLPEDPSTALLLGMLLCREARFDEGLPYSRRAVALEPESPEAHGRLGLALIDHGEFRAAVAALEEGQRRAVAQGKPRGPTAAWLERARQFLKAERRLDRVLETGSGPPDAAQRALLGMVARRKHLPVTAVRLLEPLLDSDKYAKTPFRPFAEAALAAAAASAGKGRDVESIDEAERKRLASLALTWLKRELPVIRADVNAGKLSILHASEALHVWRHDPNLQELARKGGAESGWPAFVESFERYLDELVR